MSPTHTDVDVSPPSLPPLQLDIIQTTRRQLSWRWQQARFNGVMFARDRLYRQRACTMERESLDYHFSFFRRVGTGVSCRFILPVQNNTTPCMTCTPCLAQVSYRYQSADACERFRPPHSKFQQRLVWHTTHHTLSAVWGTLTTLLASTYRPLCFCSAHQILPFPKNSSSVKAWRTTCPDHVREHIYCLQHLS